MHAPPSYLSTCSLEKYSHLFLSPVRSGDMFIQKLWTPILLHLFVWYENPYLKGNFIGFPPLNTFSYHFINLGFTFIWGFLYSFGLSSCCFSSHRHSLIFGIYFLFWMSHWVLCSFWSNIIPWYLFACDIHQTGSLRVNHNIIHCIVVTVIKTAQGWQVISSTCN